MLKDVAESKREISQLVMEHNSCCNRSKAESLIEVLDNQRVKESPATTMVIPG